MSRGSFRVRWQLLFIHEKKKTEKALFLKGDNMAKPFQQILIENIFNPDLSIQTLAFEEFLLTGL